MKKSILVFSLMAVAMAVFAIDYPTYKPTTPTYVEGSTGNGGDDNTTYGGYSTVATGGTTTYGEGSAIDEESNIIGQNNSPARGPHRLEGMPEVAPIGTPWVMLLFAAMAAVVVYLRKRKNLVTE